MRRFELGDLAVEVPTTRTEATKVARALWRLRPAVTTAHYLSDRYWAGYSAGVSDITGALQAEREKATTAQAPRRYLRAVPTTPEVSA